MSLYTKVGDGGETSLQDGVAISKQHPAVQALAALDELNASLGLVGAVIGRPQSEEIDQIQRSTMAIMSLVSAKSVGNSAVLVDFTTETTALERKIDEVERVLPKQSEFVVYGGCESSARCDNARAVARRAETKLVQLAQSRRQLREVFPYLNRLSDWLYARARLCDFEDAVERQVRAAIGKKPVGAVIGRSQNGDSLTLNHALVLITKVEQRAAEIGVNAAVAVCNEAGNSVAAHSMDGAFFVSFDIAISKAYTAAALKMPTIEVAELVKPGGMFFGLEAFANGKMVPIGGGNPIYSDCGKLIGAIGVSGGTAAQDDELARAAIDN